VHSGDILHKILDSFSLPVIRLADHSYCPQHNLPGAQSIEYVLLLYPSVQALLMSAYGESDKRE
jgi:hypothetical protein